MNGVRPVLIYLAGPLDDVLPEEARGWREQLAASAPSGVAFFSPAHAYLAVNSLSFPVVDQMNRRAIQISDGVLANLSGPGRGFGTIREIEFAVCLGTPVAVVGEVVSLLSHDLSVSESLFTALDMLLERVQEKREPPAWMKRLGILTGEEEE